MKRSFRLLALGDIHQNASEANRAIILAVTHTAFGCNPPHLSVATIDAEFGFEAAALRRLFQCGFNHFPVFIDYVREEF